MTCEAWSALGEIALCWFALWRRRCASRATTFPLIPGLLLTHLTLFGLPAALFRDQFLGFDTGLGILGSIVVPQALSPETLRLAALMVLAGMLALLVGYELPLAQALLAPLPSIRVTWRRNPVPGALLLMGCGLIAAIIEKGEHAKRIEGILDAIAFVGLWAMGALWLLNWRGLMSRSGRAATWSMTAALMSLEIVQGALWRPLIDSVLLLSIYTRARGRMPWMVIALALPFFLIMAAAKIGFRVLLPQNQTGTPGTLEKIATYRQSLELAYDDPASLDLGETLLTRMSETWVLAAVVERSPRFVPYWGGTTYLSAGWSLIPRLLMPDKPSEDSGQDFPHRYGIINSDDHQTSTNFAALIEMYANFGPSGVIIGMALFGVVCRALELIFADAATNDATYALSAPILASLLLIEQPFHGAFGGFVQHTPFLIATLALCGICRFALIPIDLAVARANRALAAQAASYGAS
ncbi:MAG TPA: hypothetical protein VMB26_03420 [Candidatus Binataceae bacterium]|nr:hypothetical protein [Candidatus Binataceae bacterium]